MFVAQLRPETEKLGMGNFLLLVYYNLIGKPSNNFNRYIVSRKLKITIFK